MAGSAGAVQTSAGTNQATATILPNAINEFTSVGASTGCTAQTDAQPGDQYIVFNNTASNDLLFYPSSTDKVNANATSFSIPTGRTMFAVKTSSTQWAAGVIPLS
jgi:hypothetical protein